jgi:hypothetical protein
MLQAASHGVCAYPTGIRDCKVQTMQWGCLSLIRGANGVIERRRGRSVVTRYDWSMFR